MIAAPPYPCKAGPPGPPGPAFANRPSSLRFRERALAPVRAETGATDRGQRAGQ